MAEHEAIDASREQQKHEEKRTPVGYDKHTSKSRRSSYWSFFLNFFLQKRTPDAVDPYRKQSLDASRHAERLLAEFGARLNEFLPSEAILRAQRVAAAEAERIDYIVGRLGLLSDDDVNKLWLSVTGMEPYRSELIPDLDAQDITTKDFCTYSRTWPLGVVDGSLLIALDDPLNHFALLAYSKAAGMPIRALLARRRDMDALLGRDTTEADSAHFGGGGEDIGSDIERLRDLASDAPVVRAVTTLLETAVDRAASDIHLSAAATGWQVRIRVDGVLEGVGAPTAPLAAVVSRLKIMAGLDIAERRLPQDGRIQVPIRGIQTDLRIVTVPHVRGEGAVIRILDSGRLSLDLRSLGLEANSFEMATIRSCVAEPHGLVVITGPTGSGKTTTLYSLLASVSDPRRNIVSVEDPVEMKLEGAHQIQVHPQIGLDFAAALRSVLRQDPDVIMVGEIRDPETAGVATQAALTGHLVFASLHTNTALGVVARLIDMGVEPFVLASTLKVATAQRLVRRLCRQCARPDPRQLQAWKSLTANLTPPESGGFEFRGPVGCPACRYRGYDGRIGIFEALAVTPEISEAIAAQVPEHSMEALVDRTLHPRLSTNAMKLAMSGVTSPEEIVRCLGSA